LTWASFGTTLALGATIRGAVSYGDGKLVGGAQVELVEPFKAGNPVRARTRTDDAGFYEFANVGPGGINCLRSRPMKAMEIRSIRFLPPGRPESPDVTVKDEGETLNANIDMGAPGGFLKGRIVDSTLQAPILNARVRKVIIDDKDRFVSFGGRTKMEISRLRYRQCRSILRSVLRDIRVKKWISL
jgi:hypothetical protein